MKIKVKSSLSDFNVTDRGPIETWDFPADERVIVTAADDDGTVTAKLDAVIYRNSDFGRNDIWYSDFDDYTDADESVYENLAEMSENNEFGKDALIAFIRNLTYEDKGAAEYLLANFPVITEGSLHLKITDLITCIDAENLKDEMNRSAYDLMLGGFSVIDGGPFFRKTIRN